MTPCHADKAKTQTQPCVAETNDQHFDSKRDNIKKTKTKKEEICNRHNEERGCVNKLTTQSLKKKKKEP